eukprot:11941130-Ditylum_brightwellii.AAC.1
MAPINDLTRKDVTFIWAPEQQNAFDRIKRTIACRVLLHFPDFSKPFHVYTDASNEQLGGVICQDDCPIAFYSCKLNSMQKNYSTLEKEVLSLTKVALKHRNLLQGFPIHFHSDHKNLQFDNIDNERVKRWKALMSDFDYKLTYTPGKDNIIADMLSRYLTMHVTKEDIAEMNSMDLADDDFPVDYAAIHRAQRQDKTADVKDPKNWLVVNFGKIPLLTRKGRIYLPPDLAERVVAWYHLNLQHPDETRTYMT